MIIFDICISEIETISIIKVLKRNTGGFIDYTGALLSRNSPPDHLKLISYAHDSSSQSYEVQAILNHRGTYHSREYLVKWKNSFRNWKAKEMELYVTPKIVPNQLSRKSSHSMDSTIAPPNVWIIT
jgi:hypothetical protein